jgi:hypothetical protein
MLRAGAERRRGLLNDPPSETISTLVSGPHEYSVSSFVTFDACAARCSAWGHPITRPAAAPRLADHRVRVLRYVDPRGRAGANATSATASATANAPRRLNPSVASLWGATRVELPPPTSTTTCRAGPSTLRDVVRLHGDEPRARARPRRGRAASLCGDVADLRDATAVDHDVGGGRVGARVPSQTVPPRRTRSITVKLPTGRWCRASTER